MNRTLDWKARFDERSRGYAISNSNAMRKPKRSYTWRCVPRLDQGQEGACVGFGWAHELAARPVEVPVTATTAQLLYSSAKQMDEWDGESYEGTSVLAGAKATKALGHITEYRWAFTLEEVLRALSWDGPIVIGVNWYEGMEEPDARGFIKPTGETVGGHCTLLNGINILTNTVRLHNSWGPSWGKNGEAFLTFEDLGKLLDNDGEACLPIGRK